MSTYHLYLDESGTFDERAKNSAPSIVAGFLTERSCTEAQAADLLNATKNSSESFASIDVNHFHAMNIADPALYEFITVLLENMSRKNYRLVVFKSDKGYVGVNSDVTYLNVFAEGIVNLLEHLLAQTTDKVVLNVCYATRLNVAERDLYGIYMSINEKSYLERIEERIDWRMLRLKDSERARVTKTFSSAKADYFAPLMLADAVCFALRGGKNNFTAEQRSRIKNLPTLKFQLTEKILWRDIQNALIEERIGEAIYSWYVRGTPTLLEEYGDFFKESVVKKLREADSASRKFQYDTLAQLIGNLVNSRDSRREFETVKNLVAALDKDFFPLIEANNFEAQELIFDTHFQRLTVATHEGNTLDEQREIELCRNILPNLPATCETLDYFLKYKLRETEYLKNIYDFEGAITELDRLEKILSSTVDLLQMIDELESFSKNIRSTTLGKVIGSRAAAKIYLATTSPSLIRSAREDSDRAIEQFTAESDKLRQFQMRSMLETRAENFRESLLWLCRAFNLDESSTPDKVLAAIKKSAGDGKKFGLLHFANLMAAAMEAERSLGREMFEAWIKQNADELLTDDTAYPVPLILWRSGKCRALQRSKTAKKFYDDATRLLLAKPENFTLFSEGLLVEADQFVTLEEGNNLKFLKKIQADYQKFSALPLPPTMRKAFAEWEKLRDVPRNELKEFFRGSLKRIPVM